MEGFKLCSNGHYFQSDMEKCPYCPANYHISEKTEPDSLRQENVKDKPNDQTRIIEKGNEKSNMTKTVIIRKDDISEAEQDTGDDRKIVGWLISFTINPNGRDFRLYEGRNTIGSDSGCDIVITNDESISAKHLTILFRLGNFLFKDELSTNGTFVNEEFLEEGTLCDGDEIRLGKTVFRFRMV